PRASRHSAVLNFRCSRAQQRMRALVLGTLLCLLAPARSHAEESPQRIITLAPSLAEITFALGAGEELVGVSSFTNYPPEAKSIPSIGGFFDSNLEKIISLKPSIVLLYPEHSVSADRLSRVGIKTL